MPVRSLRTVECVTAARVADNADVSRLSAQSLLDLPCHPKVLDIVVVNSISTNVAATRIAARIVAASGLER